MSSNAKLVILIIFLVAFFTAIGFFVSRQAIEEKTSVDNLPQEKIKVVATFLPIYVFTANVAGDAAEVDVLLPSDVGPHNYSFKPSDVLKVANARVVVKNGVELESWMDDVIESAGSPDLEVIDTGKGIDLLGDENHMVEESEEEHTEEGSLEHGEFNPHIWLDPLRAVAQVENIRDGLIAADPGNEEIYRLNAEEYIAKLRALNEEIKEITSNLENKKFISFHSSFLYFAERYGLEQAGIIEPFPGKEPGPKYIRDLIDLIERENISALFSEPQFSPQIVETLSKDLDLPVFILDPLATGEFSKDFYEKGMKRNMENLKKALNYVEPDDNSN